MEGEKVPTGTATIPEKIQAVFDPPSNIILTMSTPFASQSAFADSMKYEKRPPSNFVGRKEESRDSSSEKPFRRAGAVAIMDMNGNQVFVHFASNRKSKLANQLFSVVAEVRYASSRTPSLITSR